MRKRPLLPRQPQGMEHVFDLIGEELLAWPRVTMRPMFGMRAFYRGDKIFAMLPHKRAVNRANAVGYKLGDGAKEGEKWHLFDLEDARDVASALEMLAGAFEDAR